MFTYEVEACGVKVKHSKVFPRQLTEEEKAEADQKQTKGKAPPAKGKAAKEEEVSPEELERQEKLKAEKEEADRKAQEEWDALDEETKHYRTNEDIQKEPCIKMMN